MECQSNWEYKTLADELTRGMEQAKKLKDNWNSTSSEVQDMFLQRILSSFENSLLILNWNGAPAATATATALSVVHSPPHPSPPPLVSGPIDSSISIDNSPRSENLKPCASKKRKTLPTWTEQVKVNSQHGLEGPSNDGYSWRKYGQKDILGAKHPRSYYRCTYRIVQNCWATKHVQRTDEDPTVFDITYKGTHTCYQGANHPVTRSVSPDKQEMKQITNNNNSYELKQPNEMLINFRANLRVNTGETEDVINSPFVFSSTLTYAEGENQFYPTINAAADETFLRTYSPAFVSPTTPESDYFSISTDYMNNLCGGTSNLQHYESDHTGIISASASVTNSPNGTLDFPIDSADLDPNFPFTMSSFFT